jgi:hypothetical protein
VPPASDGVARQGLHPLKRPDGGVLSRIAPVGFNEDDPIQLLLYGRSGTGKTTVWSTFPKPILGIICSGGTRNPGELRSIAKPGAGQDIKHVRLQSSDELRTITEALHDGRLKYNTVALDHASGFQDLILKELLGLESIPVQKTWGLASRETYGTVGIKFKEYLTALVDAPANVVIVAHERGFVTDGGDSEVIQPFVGAALMPSLSGWLNGTLDYIGQTFLRHHEEERVQKIGGKPKKIMVKTAKIEYCLRVGPHPSYATKFRVPEPDKVPDVIVLSPPGSAYSKIRGAIQASQRPRGD